MGLVAEQECRAAQGVQVHFIYNYGAQSGNSLAKVSGARADIDPDFLEVDSHIALTAPRILSSTGSPAFTGMLIFIPFFCMRIS